VAFGDETYKLNLEDYNHNYDNYTRNLVGRSGVIAITCSLAVP
jgi:hypothetical protein